MKKFAFSAVIFAFALVLTGCAQTPSASPGSGSPSPVQSPTPTPSASRPALALGGDCSAALSDAEVSAAVGTTVTHYTAAPDALEWTVQQLGGIWCHWEDPSSHELAWITVIPAAAAGDSVAKEDAGQPYCYGGDVSAGQSDSCSFGVVIGPWWFAGVVYTAEGSHLHAATAITQLTSAVTPRLEAATPKVPVRLHAQWSTNLDCTAVAARADLATVLADPALQGDVGNGPAEVGPGVNGAMTSAGYRACVWDANVGSTTSTHAFTIEVVPGAAWVLDQGGIAGGSPVNIEGATATVSAPVANADVTYLYVSDGTNLMIVEPNYSNSDVMSFAPAVKPLLAALSG